MKTATEKAAPGPGPDESVLVDPVWLAGHLGDPDVRVIEVNVSPAAYNDWHIDGAVLWNIYADVKDAGYRTVGTAALEQLMERSGIGPDSTVVFYGYAPALGLWLMRLYGHRDVRILDCSRDTWRPAATRGAPPRARRPPAATAPAARTAASGQTRRRCTTPSASRAPPWWTCARLPSTGASASGPRAAWNQVAAPVTCRQLSISPSTASTTPTGRSGPLRSCAASSRRLSSAATPS